MPRKNDYVELIMKSLQGLRSSIGPGDLDLLCTFIYNYSGREITGAMRGTQLSLIAPRVFIYHRISFWSPRARRPGQRSSELESTDAISGQICA